MSALPTRVAIAAVCAIAGTALLAPPALAAAPTDGAGVVVNEIIYDDISGYSDRVELYNAGTTAVDLTGWRISDDKRDRFGAVPAGTTLAPGAFTVLIVDVDFTFGLGKADEVVLSDASGAEIDAFAYQNTAPLADSSRCPDGSASWAPATVPTPGSTNVCAPVQTAGSVRINEVDSQPADWVEFFNPGTAALDISGYEIRDNSDDHRWQFRAGTTIGAGAFLVVDESTVGVVGAGEDRFGAPIGIGSADRIRLYDRTGALIDDTLPWTAHAAINGDVAAATLARCPDGIGAFILARPTQGASNTCVMPDVAINEIESNGDATDWVEIINTGATIVDISGWTVMDNDPAGHAADAIALPAGTTLAAGERFVFDQPAHFTFGLGNGDTVTVRDATGNTVDEHTYDAHAAGVLLRCPEGTGDFFDAAVATKGLRNACGNPVRINEVESDGGSPDDWIELVNPTNTVLDVSGIVVKDDDDAHAYAIAAGTTIPALGHLVIEREALGFGLGSADSVRLFEDGALLDDTSWTTHATTTWGRCPEASGPFANTEKATKGAPNVCAGAIELATWPGSTDPRVVDEAAMFLADSSGLDTQETADGTLLWAVDNGTGRFWKMTAHADGSVAFADGWSAGKRVRFPHDAGNAKAAGPDAEGITVDADGMVYVATERDNSAKGVNRNAVLMVDPDAAGPDLVAVREWNLTAQLPQVGANLGMEAVEWVSDTDLVGKLFDDNTGAAYERATYPGHGDGLFFVAIEDGGGVFAFALGSDGSSTLVASVDPGLSGVMALDYDTVRTVLWAVCDDGCEGASAEIALNGTATPDIAHYARPAGMPIQNNEGFATAPGSLSTNGVRPAWWFADGFTSGALRTGTLPGVKTTPSPEPTDPEVSPTPTPTPEPTTAPTTPPTVEPTTEPTTQPTTGPTAEPTEIPTATPTETTFVPLPGSALTEANRGGVTVQATARPGESVRIAHTASAGIEARVVMYSTPQQLTTGTLDAAGAITAAIPADAASGEHRLALYTDEGVLIGWAPLTVTAGKGLAVTGAEMPTALLIAALALLGAGTLFVARRRTRRTA